MSVKFLIEDHRVDPANEVMKKVHHPRDTHHRTCSVCGHQEHRPLDVTMPEYGHICMRGTPDAPVKTWVVWSAL